MAIYGSENGGSFQFAMSNYQRIVAVVDGSDLHGVLQTLENKKQEIDGNTLCKYPRINLRI